MDELTGLPLAFGKKVAPKKQVTQERFEKTKRGNDAGIQPSPVRSRSQQSCAHKGYANARMIQSTAVINSGPSNTEEAPVGPSTGAEPSGSDDEAGDRDELPVTHEVVLKDHAKVSR